MENDKLFPNDDLVIVVELRFSIKSQIVPANPIGFLQNSTPSNKNCLGVVSIKNDVVGPKTLPISPLISGINDGVSDSTSCKIDCLNE